MSWNFRWYRMPDGTYQCHETYYDTAGKPNARAEEPVRMYGYEEAGAVLFDLAGMQGALGKPALDPETYAEAGAIPWRAARTEGEEPRRPCPVCGHANHDGTGRECGPTCPCERAPAPSSGSPDAPRCPECGVPVYEACIGTGGTRVADHESRRLLESRSGLAPGAREGGGEP